MQDLHKNTFTFLFSSNVSFSCYKDTGCCGIVNFISNFYFFPIIYLERNCLWNASIDAIDSTLPNEEKHRPDNIQIIPKIMNYGKHIHTQEQFLKEWNLRGFKTDFSNCTVKLPENYSIESYFNKSLIIQELLNFLKHLRMQKLFI